MKYNNEKEYSAKEQELITTIDKAINELVYEKVKLIKAYNYYHGKRDPEQFRHLEENYGIGTPTSVEFVPLVRKHVDVLVGEYLTIPVRPKVSCKDEKTLTKINQDRLKYVNDQLSLKIKDHLRSIIKGEYGSNPKLLEELDELQKNLESNFISEYEIAAQNVVDWTMQSRDIDFTNNRRILLTDLLVTGTCYYRTLESSSKSSVNLKVLNPLHTFLDRNFNSKFHKNSQRVVIRDYMTKNEILREFGEYLTKEDIDSLDSSKLRDNDAVYIRTLGDSVIGIADPEADGILGGFEVTPLYNFNSGYKLRRFPVYDVEWLQVDKEKDNFVTNRYRGIRIGGDTYILLGKVENVTRTVSDPYNCTLSVNGIFYSDRNGNPFSLILATANLQDKWDIINFYKDNLIAESGTSGDWIDLAYLPTVLGSDLAERVMKWKAYKKQGLALLDSSQEGTPPMNTTFSGFDDMLSYEAMQAFDLALERIENTCSSITGVFREKLGGIEQRDAVTNVQVGIRQSTHITKQYFYMMDLMTREMLVDMLDMCKIVYKKGITGSLVLGDRLNYVFTALPQYYTITDFDVHISETSEAIQESELIKQLSFELSKNNNIDPEIIIDIITSKSLTKMKQDVKTAIKRKSDEVGGVMQMQQQLEQAGQQMQQLQQEAEKLQKEVQRLNQEKLNLEKLKLENEKELGWFKARAEKSFKDKTIEMKTKQVQAEVLQLYDQNANNNEIVNV